MNLLPLWISAQVLSLRPEGSQNKKLVKLTIDTGIDQRTIVSGMAEHFEPEAIVGKKVSVLVNLEPREIKGI